MQSRGCGTNRTIRILGTYWINRVHILKQKFTQYPAIHTNYSLSNCTISNKKNFNRSSDFLVIN